MHVQSQVVAETGSSSFLFVSKGVAFEKKKTEDGCCCLQKQLYLVVLLDEGRVFLFVSFCFVFCLCFILPLEPSFVTYLHDSQTTYTPSSEHKHVKQYRRATLASKGNQRKKCDLSSKRVRLCQHKCRTHRWRHVSLDHPRPCERGLRIDVRYVWTPQNGSFRKRIFLKTYTCARSLSRGRGDAHRTAFVHKTR